jgi:Ca2+-binding RTX toxin-like protein
LSGTRATDSGGQAIASVGRTAGVLLLAVTASLLLAGATPAGATLPKGGNGLVAFEDGAGVDGGDVWTVRPDGSQPANLTETPLPVEELYPTFSASGRRIFFVRESPSGPDEIWSMAVDGSAQVRILTVAPSEGLWGLAASPDGRRLTFDLSAPLQTDIFLAGVDGSSPINLTNTPGISESATSFSPDGRWIAYGRCVGMDPCDLWIMRADGSGQTPLVETPTTQETAAAFSSDGRRIAFGRYTTSGDVWTMKADGSDQLNLTVAPGKTELDGFPVFSGDGTRIYFERCTATCDLWSIPAGGGAATNLTTALDADVSEPDAQSIQRCGRRWATIVGDDGPGRIVGTNRADVIVANGANDRVNARRGRDLTCGDRGQDRLRGGKGGDRLLGGPGGDRLLGGPGGDRLLGGPGGDRLVGGPGRDRLIGGPGRDRCIGGKGADTAKGCEIRKGI